MLVNSNIGLVFLDSAKRHNSSLPADGGAKRPVWMKFTSTVFAFIVYRLTQIRPKVSMKWEL